MRRIVLAAVAASVLLTASRAAAIDYTRALVTSANGTTLDSFQPLVQ